MATTAEEIAYAKGLDRLETQEVELPHPGIMLGHFGKFIEQRKRQRTVLFWFALVTSTLSLIGLFAIVFIQGYIRATSNPTFELISETGLQIFAVTIFGQVLGVVYVIAHSIWSNHEFEMFGVGKKNL